MGGDEPTGEERVSLAKDDAFDRLWKTIAKMGHCDGFGGSEYARVRSEWEAQAGDVGDLAAFIRHRADIGPSPD
jgi:hypothetical protein